MSIQLLVSVRAYREKFYMEDFMGSDDIFALVESGQFVFSSGQEQYTVNAREGAVFRRNILYHRHILSPAVMYLFRYRSDKPPFDRDHVKFADGARIASTLSLLGLLERGALPDEFSYRQHLFSDIVCQYAMENGLSAAKHRDGDPLIEQAAAHIRESINRPLNLLRVGEATGLSYVQFLRRFKAAMGLSPSDYVTALRLQKAKSLLTDTTLMIKDIASVCGFENEYYFSNFFKKQTGLSPSAFRALTI